jgi:uncharacterized delta-60 repeat protein
MRTRSLTFTALVMMGCLQSKPSYAQVGELDPTFDLDGMVVAPLASSSRINAIAVQADGRIVAVGSDRWLESGTPQRWVVQRFLPDGGHDLAFGPNGTGVIYFFGTTSGGAAYDVKIQPGDQKILVTGWYGTSSVDFTVARLLPNGSPDNSFGNTSLSAGNPGGLAVHNLSSGGSPSSRSDYSQALAIQADGKILVGGAAKGSGLDFAIARLHSNGALDTQSFGTPVKNSFKGFFIDSYTSGDQFINAGAMVIQPDGKIVIGGRSGFFGSSSSRHWMLARYNSNGSVDQTFGSAGKVVSNFTPPYNSIRSVALQSDAGQTKIVAAGGARFMTNATDDFMVARYNANGSLDSSFNSGTGFATSGILEGDSGYGLAIEPVPGGRIFVSGTIYDPSSGPNPAPYTELDMTVWALESNGNPSLGFGPYGNGFARYAGHTPNSEQVATCIALDNQGNITTGGYETADGSSGTQILARWTVN